MRKSTFILVFFLCFGGILKAQNIESTVVEGDIVVLGEVPGSNYQHIYFPRKNTIIKRGALANFNTLAGTPLVVHSLKTNEDGITQAILKRRDGRNFFRFFPKVSANIEQAIESGELKTSE